MDKLKKVVKILKLIYVCSPYRGNVDKNVKFAQECCKEVMKNNAIPIAPHLYFTQFLNDDVHDERQLAFELNKFLIKQCDVLYIFGSIISEGMKIEIDYAKSINKPVVKGVIKMEDGCVCCGEYVPEGNQVCNSCKENIKNYKAIKIKDSGNRTEFETGAVRDIHHGKGRYDLIPWDAVHELALHCEEGALKYGERNCEKGIPIHSLINSGIRHLSCYLRGMTDEPHLRAALWNIAFAIWTEKNKPEMQDIPIRKEEDNEE